MQKHRVLYIEVTTSIWSLVEDMTDFQSAMIENTYFFPFKVTEPWNSFHAPQVKEPLHREIPSSQGPPDLLAVRGTAPSGCRCGGWGASLTPPAPSWRVLFCGFLVGAMTVFCSLSWFCSFCPFPFDVEEFFTCAGYSSPLFVCVSLGTVACPFSLSQARPAHGPRGPGRL